MGFRPCRSGGPQRFFAAAMPRAGIFMHTPEWSHTLASGRTAFAHEDPLGTASVDVTIFRERLS